MRFPLLLVAIFLVVSVFSASSVNSVTFVWTTQTFTLVAPLEYCGGLCGLPFIKATYRNNLNFTLTGIAFVVVHNSFGQTGWYTTATITPAPGKTVSAYLIIAGLPSGTYNATVFVVRADVVLNSSDFITNVIPISTASVITFKL